MSALLALFSPATVAAIIGAALTIVGLHMLYAPLAYIVPGVGMVAGGLWLALGTTKRSGRP